MNSGSVVKASRVLGVGLYGFEGFWASYLLVAPMFRGPFGSELLKTMISWGIAISSLLAWWVGFRKESRERSSGKIPLFSGNAPRLALTVLLFGAILGPIVALVYG